MELDIFRKALKEGENMVRRYKNPGHATLDPHLRGLGSNQSLGFEGPRAVWSARGYVIINKGCKSVKKPGNKTMGTPI